MSKRRERRPKPISAYLVCFHSEPRSTLDGCNGQFRVVESAIKAGEWPYDNGDDPSFYVARKGGPLTWGVCRQDLRNSITVGSIVVFFSFTPKPAGETLYRLCAVATVENKVAHYEICRDARLSRFSYINTLIAPDNGGWRHEESDRPRPDRHKDWFWRIARHSGKQEVFDRKYAAVVSSGRFMEADVTLASNYVLFSADLKRTFISPVPPPVATAKTGGHEVWSNPKLQELTVGTAGRTDGRGYLRSINDSNRNLHRQIRFKMSSEDSEEWRSALIAALGGPATAAS